MEVSRLPRIMALIHLAQPVESMSASRKWWGLAASRAVLCFMFVVVFLAGYMIKAAKPPEIQKRIVERVEVQEVIVPGEDYDKLRQEKHDKERAELTALREKIRAEAKEMREQILAERKELTKQRQSVMYYWMSEIGEKEFEQELEKEVDKRIKLRQEKTESQDAPR